MKKRVLIVAYHYPPTAAVGGIRPSKFVRYLPDFGWEPTVLTTLKDEVSASMMRSEIAEIHRVREWPHPLKSYQHFKEWSALRKGVNGPGLTEGHSAYRTTATKNMGFVKSALIAACCVPDCETGWFLPAFWRGVALIRDQKIGHLLTTGPPHTCHLIGAALKRTTGIRWIADCRDPWSVALKAPTFRSAWTDRIEGGLIKWALCAADGVVSTTAQMTDLARKEHPNLDPSKFFTITNGFDPEDFRGLTSSRSPTGPVVFSYIGSFYCGRTPEPFLHALRSLLDDSSLEANDVIVRFTGDVAYADGVSVREMVRRLELDTWVTLEPPVTRSEALRRTMATHVALVHDEHHPAQVPLKLYEALAAGVLVLNIGRHGAVSEILRRTDRGVAVDHRDVGAIRAAIMTCMRRCRGASRAVEPEPWAESDLAAFDFRRLTGALACALDGDTSPSETAGKL